MRKKTGNPVGKPPKYKTVQELQRLIDIYFNEVVGIKLLKDEKGNLIKDAKDQPMTYLKPPTTCGLALHLGFLSRASLVDYGNKDEYSATIKNARLRVEQFAEEQLYSDKHQVGAIFALKNHGWKDKNIVEHEGVDSFVATFRSNIEKI